MKLPHGIRWKFTLAYLLSVLISIAALGFYLSRWTDNYYTTSLRSELASEGRFVGRMCLPAMSKGVDAVHPLARQAGSDLGCRVTIVRADGVVLGDSHSDPAAMESHADRPEVRQALVSGFGWSIRGSKTLHTRMLYTAVRFGDQAHGTLGVARLSENLSKVDQVRGRIHRVFFLAALLAFLAAALIGARAWGSVIGRVVGMNEVARNYAKGELDRRVRTPARPRDEIDELGETLNYMACELQCMIDELSAEDRKLMTIFEQTDDGLMVVDHESRVQMLNPAASVLLKTQAADVTGKTVIEATLSHDLAELVARVLRTCESASLEVELAVPERTDMNVYAAPLERPDEPCGALVVMHDMSAAKHIDSVRRDFVSNVSHEFRTPLATIKAMAETITLRAANKPEVAPEFASKIMGEADRLTALADDLLDLAKIEAGQRPIHSEVFHLGGAVDEIVSALSASARVKAIEVSAEIPDALMVCADREAVRQILSNLIDNALKYTRPGGKVSVLGSAEGKWVTVKVSDTGIGIAEEDRTRVFERFYRADKARSRESGGTGLGLSIVKHLVELHGGKVTVESALDEGSTFTFTLPKAG